MKKFITLCFSIMYIVLFAQCDIKEEKPVNKTIPHPLFGITVDDSWQGADKLMQIIEAIRALNVKPTVRIVMSNEIPIEEYIDIFRRIHEVAYVLAQPVDSYYMQRYTSVDAYRKRFLNAYTKLAIYVDMWEIANEINGEGWLGDNRQFNADKMYAAYKLIRDKGAKTVLVSYEVEPEGQEMTMLDWLQKYVPADMKEHLDYLMVSYYEDDHYGYQPDWQSVFENLEVIFPNTMMAIGECGNTAKNATVESKIKMAHHYYTMPRYTKNFVGGYFWWNWVRDCVPHQGNLIWEEINNCYNTNSPKNSGR